MDDRIREKLEFVYGVDAGVKCASKLERLIGKWGKILPEIPVFSDGNLTADQGDAVMITYGDNIQEPEKLPLAVLKEFADEYLAGKVSGIHVLPFSPYSSDDGFAVMDYRQINPEWGDWEHLSALAENFKLMADLVLNHCSAQGTWFKQFLEGSSRYRDYFITVPPETDLSAVFRPRALPLLHEFPVDGEPLSVWTTFSADQVDLNFANPEVFLEFVDILLDYINRGSRIIRLDAVGFLWKEIGTSCIHHPKTHEIIKLFRLILAETAPGVILITETNVPHKENISYFGDGKDEAHMVYQFTLPPLTLDAFIRGDASKLTAWALTLPPSNPQYSFFNFLASHDGVGLLPARGHLNEEELENLIAEVKNRGGLVSYKSTPQGDIPYELNISYRDAVAEKDLSDGDKAAKFLSSQAVMLAMAGVPGIYIHSLLGSGNWVEGVGITGINRTINREKLSRKELENELKETGSLRHLIFSGYRRMLTARRSSAAFHPAGEQRVLDLGPEVFALQRRTPEGGNLVLCLQAVTGRNIRLSCPPGIVSPSSRLRDLISGRFVESFTGDDGGAKIDLGGWEVLWLEQG